MLKFFGASDDLVECRGDHYGEIDCYDDFVVARVGDDAGGCEVVMVYDSPILGGKAAVWTGCVRQLSENVPIPWPIGIESVDRDGRPGAGYSVAVVIDCPPGTPVVWWTGERGAKSAEVPR